MKIVNEILRVNSMVLDSIVVQDGKTHFYLRFHSSVNPEVSDILSRFTEDAENTRIESLGPSPGLISILKEINKVSPLGLVCYRIPLDQGERKLLKFLNENDVAELCSSFIYEDEFRAVLYHSGQKQLQSSSIKPVSARNSVYEIFLKNDFLYQLRVEANKFPILRLRTIVEKLVGSLVVSVFLPVSQMSECYALLFRLSRESDKRAELLRTERLNDIIIERL